MRAAKQVLAMTPTLKKAWVAGQGVGSQGKQAPKKTVDRLAGWVDVLRDVV